MLVELVELRKRNDGAYYLSKIYVNPKHIIYVSEDRQTTMLMKEGNSGLGLVKGATFSKVKIDEGNQPNNITVVGDPSSIEHKIFKKSTRRILRG
jgi:hypothetical protein